MSAMAEVTRLVPGMLMPSHPQLTQSYNQPRSSPPPPMWLVQAVGSVNGQECKPLSYTAANTPAFQFVLEQKRSYLVGRDKAAEIRFTDRSVRPKEGVLEVGDWDPTDVSLCELQS